MPMSSDVFFGGPSPSPSGAYFNGRIDDVRIYNHALSESEIAALYIQAPEPPFQLTIIPPAGVETDYQLEWPSQGGMFYNLRSSTALNRPTGNWDIVENEMPANPPINTHPWLSPIAPRQFVVVEEYPPSSPPPFFSADFEKKDGGFSSSSTAGSVWAVGTPDSGGSGGAITSGGNGSTQAWATNLGDLNGVDGDEGYYTDPTTVSRLISPPIDLSAVDGAALNFTQALDFPETDSAIVRIFRASDHTEIISGSFPITILDHDPASANWQTSGPHLLPVGEVIRIEWIFSGATSGHLGWYVDDVGVEKPVPPNIVVIFTDDQTFSAIGYANSEISTPNLDTLASQGLIFDRAFVASPICAASRASMMTGMYPQQNGVYSLGSSGFQPYKTGGAQAELALGIRLQALGYYTAAYGKSHLGEFTTYGFNEGLITPPDGDKEAFSKVATFLTTNQAKAQPFFLWVAPKQPHVPLRPEPEWLNLYDASTLPLPENFLTSPLTLSINNQGLPGEDYYRDSAYIDNWMDLPAGPPRSAEVIRNYTKAYYAVVSHLDSQVATMVQQLKDEGLWENTILFFLSDNGYHLGNHGLGNKLTMHEESVRVPMFAVGLGVVAGQRSSSLVSTLDLYPTLLKIAGATTLPANAAGQSLLPILENPAMEIQDTVFSESVGIGGGAGQGHRMARSETHKYVLTGTNEEYLFDIQSDPFELENLINDPDYVTVRDQLRAKLEAWMLNIGDRTFPVFTP
jgi:arylsulfatase A-like enzyme